MLASVMQLRTQLAADGCIAMVNVVTVDGWAMYLIVPWELDSGSIPICLVLFEQKVQKAKLNNGKISYHFINNFT